MKILSVRLRKVHGLFFLLTIFPVLVLCKPNISVSGISSGGFASVQYHIAFSSQVTGNGVIAGGPYWCAKDNLETAEGACMDYPELINLNELYEATTYAYETRTIDAPSNLKNHKVWIFSGTADTVVQTGVVEKLQQYYEHYTEDVNIQTVYNIPAEHSFVTNDFGNNCSYLGPNYINNCDFDSAGAILQWILGKLNPPTTPTSQIISINQSDFMPPEIFDPEAVGLYEKAYAYVPNSCYEMNADCKIHVAFHGCLQTVYDLGDTFYTQTGYNNWAESNGIIILYPQAVANAKNPKGCFDWWGYSGADYATQLGPQMYTVNKMVTYLINMFGIQ
mmetsp:Transcript_7685/g.10604  ORF Transcript_7685/g.10604 Transcript_7685/m.10604 type:complete len:334 (-) Transcript_7685:72-1073(-)